jgi:hypothetical protein
MLAKDDALCKILKTNFWHFHCFQKMHTVVHLKSLTSSSSQVKLNTYLENEYRKHFRKVNRN